MKIMPNRLDRGFEQYQEEFENKALEVLRSGWYILGKEVQEFEKEFAAYTGAKHCVGLASGLDALWIAFRVLGIGAGDEVIVHGTRSNSNYKTDNAATECLVWRCEKGAMEIDNVTFTDGTNTYTQTFGSDTVMNSSGIWGLENVRKTDTVEPTFNDGVLHVGEKSSVKFNWQKVANVGEFNEEKTYIFEYDVKTGIASAGGFGALYCCTDICDGESQGTDGINYSLVSREMIANMIEIHANATPFDAGVYLSSCDKGLPGCLMGLCRVNIPAIVVPGGTMNAGPDMLTLNQLGEYSAKFQRGEIEEEELNCSFCPRVMLPLAVATSIDALAAGVSFAVTGANIWIAIACIGVTTFAFSAVGVRIGNIFGAKYQKKAEIVGGLILIAMGIKILIEHLTGAA